MIGTTTTTWNGAGEGDEQPGHDGHRRSDHDALAAKEPNWEFLLPRPSPTFGKRMYWHDRAGCREEDPELFFPTSTSGPDHDRQVSMAKAVCERCEVRLECLEDALGRQVKDGIWGGMTDAERRRLALTGGARRRILA